LMGAATAWVREYAARYRHSKLIVVNLCNEPQGSPHICSKTVQQLVVSG
jgi:hypothetical protein